jgi:DNA polymerase III subunit gamma/tau
MDVANYEATLTAWCEKFDTEDINGVSVQVDVIPGPPSGEAVKFHWNRVLGLCAALDDESDADRSSGRLLDRLKIPPKMRRHPGPIGEGLLEFSGALTVAAIENSSINHMGALSAFDASAWPWIRSGWERKEHTDRQEEIKKRQHAIAQLQKLWASDHDRQRVEVEKLLNEWAREPESRARRWHGGA